MAKEPYTRWVLDRVQVVKLPFDIDPEYKPDVPDSPPMSLEEIDNLKNALKQAQREKEELELNLHNLTKEKRQMQHILESKDQQIRRDREAFENESLRGNVRLKGC